MLDIILIILGVLCLMTGLMGCVLPFLPGPPVAYLGLIFLHFTDKVQYSTTQLIVWLLIVVVIQILDYFTPMLGSKYSGGSKWGNWGCIIGTLVGLLFLPWGVIFGPLLLSIFLLCADIFKREYLENNNSSSETYIKGLRADKPDD